MKSISRFSFRPLVRYSLLSFISKWPTLFNRIPTDAMQQDNQDNLQSWFSIGKVHGLPYRPWDGAVGNPPWDPNTTWGGYCTHGSVLFPTWHRPYLMLQEVSSAIVPIFFIKIQNAENNFSFLASYAVTCKA